MKKLILFMLTALLALPALAFTYTYEGQTLQYTVLSEEDKTVEVSSTSSYPLSGDLVIPSQVEDGDETYRVTVIGNIAFDGCSSLQSVVIPEGVTGLAIGLSTVVAACSQLSSRKV